MARLAALEAARGSFEAAHAAITRRCGPVIGKRRVEKAVVSAAADIGAFYAARVPQPCTASTLLVISADAKGIVMRPGELRPATARTAARQGKMRTGVTAGEKPNRKRMAALTCVYDAEPARSARTTSSPSPAGRPYDVLCSGAGVCGGGQACLDHDAALQDLVPAADTGDGRWNPGCGPGPGNAIGSAMYLPGVAGESLGPDLGNLRVHVGAGQRSGDRLGARAGK